MGSSGATPGQRSALIMPNARLTATTAPPLPVRDLGSYLYEPAGAVIRAGVIAELGAQLDAGSSTRRSPTSRATGSAAHPSRSHLRFSNSCPSISRRCAPGCGRRRSVFWRSRNGVDIDPGVTKAAAVGWTGERDHGGFTDAEWGHCSNRRASVTSHRVRTPAAMRRLVSPAGTHNCRVLMSG